MKIFLYTLCDGAAHARFDAVSDYQLECTHHGLVKLGHEIVDFPLRWCNYKQVKEQNLANWNQIWGRGMTIYGLLDFPENPIRENEIHQHKFDLIIIGVHHTKHKAYSEIIQSIQILREQFKETPIALIDGHDTSYISDGTLNACKHYKVKYFKRELDRDITDILKPIDFSFPSEKIFDSECEKKNIFAPLIPVNQSIDSSYMSTYIYDTEESYYDMYRKSMFGLTSKKGGWSTMRHLEIIANKCVPYFVDIELCPKNTLFRFSKDLLIEAKKLALVNTKDGQKITQLPHCGFIPINNIGELSDNYTVEKYNEVRDAIFDHFKKYQTTTSMAQYIIDETKT